MGLCLLPLLHKDHWGFISPQNAGPVSKTRESTMINLLEFIIPIAYAINGVLIFKIIPPRIVKIVLFEIERNPCVILSNIFCYSRNFTNGSVIKFHEKGGGWNHVSFVFN